MRLFIAALLGVTVSLVQAFPFFLQADQKEISGASSFNPAKTTLQSRPANLQPVSYNHRNQKRHRQLMNKRDYALTLKFLKAAMESYRRNSVNPPPVGFVQLEQTVAQLPDASTDSLPMNTLPLPQQVVSYSQLVDPYSQLVDPYSQQVESFPPQVQTIDTPELIATDPLVEAPPFWDPLVKEPAVTDTNTVDTSTSDTSTNDTGTTKTKDSDKPKVPKNADIEEDDEYDPEEDPDDVDDPPIINGVAVNREE